MFATPLPPWERRTYWLVGISGISYAVYIMFLEGERYKKSLINATFSSGWSWLGRDQDQSDTEWNIWWKSLHRKLLLMCVHVLLSRACFVFRVGSKLHCSILLLWDLGAVYFCFGIKIVLLHVSMAVVVYAASLLSSITMIWLIAVAMIGSLNHDWIYLAQIKFLGFHHFEEEFQFNIVSAFVFLRLISFAVDKIQHRRSSQAAASEVFIQSKTGINCDACLVTNNSNNGSPRKLMPEYPICSNVGQCESLRVLNSDPSLLQLLFYSFYLPAYFDGPFFLYSDFHCQVEGSFTGRHFQPDFFDIAKQLFRIAFWALIVEFHFHFLYYGALSLHPAVMTRLPVWAVAAMGYCQGQFFMVKYLVMYGLAIQLSRLDGLSPLAVPRCISWTHSYVDMWKYFDVGLYNFIKRYIYFPLGGSRRGAWRQLLASGASFLFIFYWHGARLELFIWCFGNFVMGIVEAVGRAVELSSFGNRLKSWLGPVMFLRCQAALTVPIYLSSSLQVIFFFFHLEVGWISVSKMVTQASWSTLLTEFVIFYACIQNAFDLHQRYKSVNR